jgi:hypothetical protein
MFKFLPVSKENSTFSFPTFSKSPPTIGRQNHKKKCNKIIGFVMNWQVRRGGQGAKCIGSNNKNGNKRRPKRKENKSSPA